MMESKDDACLASLLASSLFADDWPRVAYYIARYLNDTRHNMRYIVYVCLCLYVYTAYYV